MKGRSAGAVRVGVAMFGLAAALVACGPGAASPAPTLAVSHPASPVATPSPSATPTPAPLAAPLLVTLQWTGPVVTPDASIKLTLTSEQGTVVGSVDDPGGIDGDAYAVGSNHVYFIDGTTVKAMGRDGTVSVAGAVPQVSISARPSDRQAFIALAVSPDESTLLFGIPRAISYNNDRMIAHSQLWSEPVGGASSSATMVFDETAGALMPFAWIGSTVWVSDLNATGLGGAGPFIDYSAYNPATFDSTSHALTPIPSGCFFQGAATIDSAGNYACQSDLTSQTLKVSVPSGTKTVTMQPANADAFGAVRVSDDGRYVAYGAFVGTENSGTYSTTVVDLNSAATVATLTGYAPEYWLADDRLVVTQFSGVGPAYLLSAAFSNPLKIASDRPVGALP